MDKEAEEVTELDFKGNASFAGFCTFLLLTEVAKALVGGFFGALFGLLLLPSSTFGSPKFKPGTSKSMYQPGALACDQELINTIIKLYLDFHES